MGQISNDTRVSFTTALTPSARNRKVTIPHDATLYRQRHRIEIMFGMLKDWRRIAMRYDRCAHTIFSAITLAATIIFRRGQLVLSRDALASVKSPPISLRSFDEGQMPGPLIQTRSHNRHRDDNHDACVLHNPVSQIMEN